MDPKTEKVTYQVKGFPDGEAREVEGRLLTPTTTLAVCDCEGADKHYRLDHPESHLALLTYTSSNPVEAEAFARALVALPEWPTLEKAVLTADPGATLGSWEGFADFQAKVEELALVHNVGLV